MTTLTDDTMHCCPYCGQPLIHATEADCAQTTLAHRLARPVYVETRVRDINVGLALGLPVVLFMDIGTLVRHDDAPLSFTTNLVIAITFSILLPLWYWRMRVDSAAANAERFDAYQLRLETWRHTWWCARCDAVFVRE